MKRALVVGLAALVAAGCSSPGPESPGVATTTAVSTSAATAAGVTALDVTIAGGEVTPVDRRVEGKVGEEIVLTVNSDAVDEIHVHSVPEYSFPVAVGDDQQFRFTVDVPGSVDVELHEIDVTVATVLVRP
ncbi:hypothetical protein [Rhodococcus sp. 077-4]|uniref:hypothetical protein n=1 Tax=Rhodococcus sp. 077-4 TaxID=2789271 RepID=UPI0039F5C470